MLKFGLSEETRALIVKLHKCYKESKTWHDERKAF